MAPKSRLAGKRSRFPFPSAELEAAATEIERADRQSEFLGGVIFGALLTFAPVALAALWRLAA